jgi:hypothetical protein
LVTGYELSLGRLGRCVVVAPERSINACSPIPAPEADGPTNGVRERDFPVEARPEYNLVSGGWQTHANILKSFVFQISRNYFKKFKNLTLYLKSLCHKKIINLAHFFFLFFFI